MHMLGLSLKKHINNGDIGLKLEYQLAGVLVPGASTLFGGIAGVTGRPYDV